MTPGAAPRINRLNSGGLIVNYLCSSACAHCVYRSSPRRERGYITPEMAANAFRAARRLGCRGMHIGGGEPFLDLPGLLAVLQTAAATGMPIDYIETNSSWYRGGDQADGVLRRIREVGGARLLVSLDPFHNAYIPLAKVRGVMAACRRAGIEFFVWRAEFLEEISAFDERQPHPIEEYVARYGEDYLPRLERRYGMNLGGRALTTFGRYHRQRPLAAVLAELDGGCASLLGGNHFHMDLQGDFVPTGCPGLAVALDDLPGPLDPQRHAAYCRLCAGGPRALLPLAEAHGFRPRDTYFSACALCDHLRTHLAVHAPAACPDLRPKAFYTVDSGRADACTPVP